MGNERVTTNTICPFPFILSYDPSVPNCSVTYAEGLGASFDIFQGIFQAIALFCFVVQAYRLWRLKGIASEKHVSIHKLPSFPFFLAAFFFDLSFVVELVDPSGFRNICPIEVYKVFDEICIALGVSSGLYVADFLVRTSKGFSRTGFSLKFRNVFIFLIWLNFLVGVTLQIIDHKNYILFQGIKNLGGSVILATFCAFSIRSVVKILHTMEEAIKLQKGSSSVAASNLETKKKFFRIITLLLFASLLQMIIAVISFTAEDFSWIISYEEQYDPMLIAVRVLFAFVAILAITLFRIPKHHFSDTASSSIHENRFLKNLNCNPCRFFNRNRDKISTQEAPMASVSKGTAISSLIPAVTPPSIVNKSGE